MCCSKLLRSSRVFDQPQLQETLVDETQVDEASPLTLSSAVCIAIVCTASAGCTCGRWQVQYERSCRALHSRAPHCSKYKRMRFHVRETMYVRQCLQQCLLTPVLSRSRYCIPTMGNPWSKNVSNNWQHVEKLYQQQINMSSSRHLELEVWRVQSREQPGVPARLLVIVADQNGFGAVAGLWPSIEAVTAACCAHTVHGSSYTNFERVMSSTVKVDDQDQEVQAVLLYVAGDQLSDEARTVMALCLEKGLALVTVASTAAGAADARRFTNNTWPVFQDHDQAVQWLGEELPRVVWLKQAIEDDVGAKCEQFRKVHMWWHACTRGAVALVPFGVLGVNMVGFLRLCYNMMYATGMVKDTEAAKMGAAQSGKAAATAWLIDLPGDIYQAAAYSFLGGHLLAAHAAAQAAIHFTDVATLGSIGILTAALSVCGACATRAKMVDATAKYLAMLQLIYILNPAMRQLA